LSLVLSELAGREVEVGFEVVFEVFAVVWAGEVPECEVLVCWGVVGPELGWVRGGGGGGGEELGSDPSAAVEEGEVHYPCVCEEDVGLGLDAGGDGGGEGGKSWLSCAVDVPVGKTGEVMLQSGGSEKGGLVESSKEGMDSALGVCGRLGGDYRDPFAFEGEVDFSESADATISRSMRLAHEEGGKAAGVRL